MPAQHAHVLPEEVLGFRLPPRGPDGLHPADCRRLVADLKKADTAWPAIAPHIAFDSRGYIRKRLFRDSEWEMLLLCWLPGQTTVVHDHGDSWGATLVIGGTLRESLYRWEGQGRKMPHLKARTLKTAGVTVETLETIHRNENLSSAPAISIHLYSPPLRALDSFDPVSGERHTVKMAEGPWVAVGGNPRLKPQRARIRTGRSR